MISEHNKHSARNNQMKNYFYKLLHYLLKVSKIGYGFKKNGVNS